MRARCLVPILSALALAAAAASACGRPPDPRAAAVRATAPGDPDASSAADPAPKITYGGSVDFYYSANLNHPFDARNALRYPEVTDEHGPHLDSLNLWAEGPRTPVGFRVDLGYDRS